MCNICGDAQHDPAVSRRSFLKTGAAAALAPLFAGVAFAADPPKPGAPPPPNAIAPADALKRLMDGNARYAANTLNERDFSSGRAARSQAQYPIASIWAAPIRASCPTSCSTRARVTFSSCASRATS